jgi:predicted aspartyl protease
MCQLNVNQPKNYALGPIQAHATVTIYGPQASVMNIYTLVDTGATYSFYPSVVAQTLGFNTANSRQVQATLADGSAITLDVFDNVTVDIEGVRFQTSLAFHQNARPDGIIGLQTISDGFECGFDKNHWLWR